MPVYQNADVETQQPFKMSTRNSQNFNAISAGRQTSTSSTGNQSTDVAFIHNKLAEKRRVGTSNGTTRVNHFVR